MVTDDEARLIMVTGHLCVIPISALALHWPSAGRNCLVGSLLEAEAVSHVTGLTGLRLLDCSTRALHRVRYARSSNVYYTVGSFQMQRQQSRDDA